MRTSQFSAAAVFSLGLTISCLPFSAQAAVTVPATPTDATNPLSTTQSSDPGSDDHGLDEHMIGELERRKAALDRREHDLQLRESQAAAAELLARRELAQLSALREEVEKMVNQQTAGADADLNLLAGFFSNMKPTEAAAILGKLEVPKAAAIMRKLQTRMAGPVLAAMDSTVAAGITQELERARAPFQN